MLRRSPFHPGRTDNHSGHREPNDIAGIPAHELLNEIGWNVALDHVVVNFRRATRRGRTGDPVSGLSESRTLAGSSMAVTWNSLSRMC